MPDEKDDRLIRRLNDLLEHFHHLQSQLQDPAIYTDKAAYVRIARQVAELKPLTALHERWQRVGKELDEARRMLGRENDPEMRAYLKEEIDRLETEYERLWTRMLAHLVPRDPRDERNVILEIRAGTGGEEAALFAADLLRMYQRYVERQGWRMSVLEAHPTDLGGFREVVSLIEGRGAYSRLKFESGIHRVQRVPVTEAGGRIHTSAVSVAVLPEAEPVEVEIRPEDLRVDVFSASGPGGQHVNKAMTAVRITHLPTGIVVVCQDERSLGQNRRKALRVLQTRLLDYYRKQQEETIAETRRSQVGTGDRSEKIRTYNFPQNRVTDHRIGLTLYRLETILDGALDPIIEALLQHEQAEKLKELTHA